MTQLAKFVALQILRGYKWAISPLFPPACRYVPTCSEYAMEAIERYGVLRGGVMAVWRLMRCHPLAHGGYDPVVKATGTSAAKAAVEEEGIIAALKRCAPQNLWHLRFCTTKIGECAARHLRKV